MSAATFSEVWRRVRLYAESAPAHLTRDWVQGAYNDLCGRRHWAWLRTETILSTQAARTISVTLGQGSATVTTAGAWLSTDVGRQLRVGTGPIYTIDLVNSASEAVLTQVYQGTSGVATARVQDIYLVMPADFRSFHTVNDLTIQRPIAWWISKDRLDLFDPGRIASDSRFRVLASGALSTVTSLSGRVLYEAWPYPTAAGSYLVSYFKRSDTIGEDTRFQGVLATRGDVLIEGALARCARWPGRSKQDPNPYFNLKLAEEHESRFTQFCLQLDVMDDDQYLMDLQQVDLSKFGLAALSADTTLMRQSDATLADYY